VKPTTALFGPTPQKVIKAVLPLLELRPGDILYDPGCGDARVLIAACREYGCHGVGYEIQPRVAKLAREKVKSAGLEGRVLIVEGDSSKLLSLWGHGREVVYCYLWPELIQKLTPEIKKARSVLCYQHATDDLKRESRQLEVIVDKEPHRFYLREPEAY
jgi:SAM-dependent methyltransferase